MLWIGLLLGLGIAAWGLRYNRPSIQDYDLQRAHFLCGGGFAILMLIGLMVV